MEQSGGTRLTYREHLGAGIAAVTEDLARLRIEVFRDWPYLYDGDLDYERRYLAEYAAGDGIVVAAHDGGRMVGAATGMPLAAHADGFAAAFEGTGIDMGEVFYCAESVLLPDYRGQGAYRRFFDRREDRARALGFPLAAFCGVVRPEDHPLRPADARPLDPVWRRFGYAPLPGAVARFAWRDIGETAETEKPLQVWIKRL